MTEAAGSWEGKLSVADDKTVSEQVLETQMKVCNGKIFWSIILSNTVVYIDENV